MIPLWIEKKAVFAYYGAPNLALHDVCFYKDAIYRHNHAGWLAVTSTWVVRRGLLEAFLKPVTSVRK